MGEVVGNKGRDSGNSGMLKGGNSKKGVRVRVRGGGGTGVK